MKTQIKLLIMVYLLYACSSSAQVTVYKNAFTCQGGTGISKGTPALAFKTVTSLADNNTAQSGAQIGGVDAFWSHPFTNNQLVLWVDAGNAAFTTAPLSYAVPFKPLLSSNTDMVTWTFNMRTSTATMGDKIAVVLGGTEPDLQIAGNGYAVIWDAGNNSRLQLVRYNNGLQGAITIITTSNALLTQATDYASIKVTYNPDNSEWMLYVRDDGPVRFSLPDMGIYSGGAMGKDDVYTGAPMVCFGFYSNYHSVSKSLQGIINCHLFDPANASRTGFAYFDNYAVSIACTPPSSVSAAIAPGIICSGSSLSLTGTAKDGVTYAWAGPDGYTSSIQSPNISATRTDGTYTFTAFSTSGCPAIATVYAAVDAISAPVVSQSDNDINMVLTANKGKAFPEYTYQWYNNGIAVAGFTTQSITAVLPGNYAVIVTDKNGCQAKSGDYLFTGASTISDNILINIYPNPAQNILHIASSIPVTTEITAIDGRLLLSQPHTTDIDISGLANGIYIVMLYDDKGQIVKTEKLVKTAN